MYKQTPLKNVVTPLIFLFAALICIFCMVMLFSCDNVNKNILLWNILNEFGEGYVAVDILHYIGSVWPWHLPWSKTNIW
jgi:hypothetical protein